MWFERSSYIFPEGAGQPRREIAIVTAETELNVPVLLSVNSTRSTATQGTKEFVIVWLYSS